MIKNFIKPLYLDIKTFILDTIFPITCVSCGADGNSTPKQFYSDSKDSADINLAVDNFNNDQKITKTATGLICGDCKSTFKKLEHQRCIVCQRQAVFGLTHENCKTPHGADGLISFYDYHDEKIAKIIIAGKYKFIPDVFKELGQIIGPLLISQYPHIPISDSILVPIPLHSTRKNWRGFNQSEILAQTISQFLNIPNINLLARSKITKTQKDLKKDQRQKNMADAFKLKPDTDIKNKNIILIDDVTTTGATLQQAAKMLKQKGAGKVICLTVARD